MNVIRYRSTLGVKMALQVSAGPKFISIVAFEHPIKIEKLPATESRFIEPVNVPVKQALATLKRMARVSYGSLRTAPKAIKVLLRGAK